MLRFCRASAVLCCAVCTVRKSNGSMPFSLFHKLHKWMNERLNEWMFFRQNRCCCCVVGGAFSLAICSFAIPTIALALYLYLSFDSLCQHLYLHIICVCRNVCTKIRTHKVNKVVWRAWAPTRSLTCTNTPLAGFSSVFIPFYTVFHGNELNIKMVDSWLRYTHTHTPNQRHSERFRRTDINIFQIKFVSENKVWVSSQIKPAPPHTSTSTTKPSGKMDRFCVRLCH